MSGETQKDESGWSVDTLKAHVDQRFVDNDKAVQAALVSQEKAVAAALAATKEAVSKAEAASEKRFESVNEFRQTLSDQTASFLPRPEYDANHKALEDKIETQCQALSDKIQGLTDRVNTATGQARGSEITMSKIYAAIAAVGAILAIVVLMANNVL